jgi:hypothetical protein
MDQRSYFDFRQEKRHFFFQRLRIGFGPQKSAYLVGTEDNALWQGGHAMKLIIDLCLVPRLRTRGAITQLPSCLHVMHRDSFTFRAVRLHTPAFWVMISCSVSVGTNYSEEHLPSSWRLRAASYTYTSLTGVISLKTTVRNCMLLFRLKKTLTLVHDITAIGQKPSFYIPNWRMFEQEMTVK